VSYGKSSKQRGRVKRIAHRSGGLNSRDKAEGPTISPPIVFVHLPLRQGGESKLHAIRQLLSGSSWGLPIEVVHQVCDQALVDLFVLVHAPLEGFKYATVLPHASIVGFPGECAPDHPEAPRAGHV